MADGGIVPSVPGARDWAEPDPGGCGYVIPIDPERTTRNRAILAEVNRKLTLANFDTTPAIQPPALTEV